MILDANRVRLGNLLIHGTNRLDLDNLPLLCRIAVIAEDYRSVLRHTLLRYNRALTTTYDEVTTNVLWTLTEIHGMNVLLLSEKAQAAANHDGDLAKMRIREHTLVSCLATVLVIRANGSDLDVNGKWRGVGQIAKASVIRKHW